MAKPRKRPEKSALSAPSVRIFHEWTPGRLRAAERMAEQGELTMAASICEWLLTDDRVSGALGARSDALLGLEPAFDLGAGRRSRKALKALEADEDWWESYPESQLALLVTWGILLGVAPAQQLWVAREDHGDRVLPKPRFWHPQTLRWDDFRREWTIRDNMQVQHVVTPGDGEWILHCPYGDQRPWALGLWRSLARWVLLKQFAISDWARHSEKGSRLVATSPENAVYEQRKELVEDISACGEDSVIALAAGFDLKLLELTANTRDIYQAQIEMADLAIAVRIRGGNLSSNVEGGSLAAAESQASTNEAPKLRFDAAALASTLHDQSLIWWADYNFGDQRLAPWPSYPVEPEEDKAARSSMVLTLGQGVEIWDRLGFDIDPKTLTEDFGLTFITGRSRPAQPAQPMMPPGAPRPAPPGQDDEEEPEPTDDDPDDIGLASGALAAANTGFLHGQLYADALEETSEAKAVDASAPTMKAILEELRAAKGYADLRARLRARYRKLDPSALSELVYRTMYLAEMAGRAAVNEDSGGRS